MSLLPNELVLAIAVYLPENALVSLALTCVSFSRIAQRVLYRHLTATTSSPNIALVALLAKKREVARLVRSLFVALDPAVPIFSRFYALLATALCNTSELHSLHLLIDNSATWVLRDLPVYPNLAHFSSSFSIDHNVLRFLHLTPNLCKLELDTIPATHPVPLPCLPDSSIPRLDHFIGSLRAASLIVPGRPVTNIHLNASALAEDDIPLLARSTAPVLVLSAVINSSPVPFLELLHRHLPHLAYLRIMSTQTLCQPPSPAFYADVATVLGSFSQLNAFELSGIHWGSQRNLSKRTWQSSPLFLDRSSSHM